MYFHRSFASVVSAVGQSVVISDIPPSLYLVRISTALAVPSVMSDSKTACSFVMFVLWSVVNVRLTHSIVTANRILLGCLLHPQFGKLLASKFQDNIKRDVGLCIFEVFHNLAYRLLVMKDVLHLLDVGTDGII